jgi:penicillin-binding protein 1A
MPIARWLAAVVAAGLAMAIVVAGIGISAKQLRTVAGWKPKPVTLPELDQRTVVYAADGSVAAVLHAGQDRKTEPLSQIAPVLVNAVIDTEDARFWQHGPVDAKAVVRAFRANAQAGSIRQGGSTLTQQLAKNTLLSSKQDVSRKIREVVLANQLLKQLGRQGVLERYLNTVYFGDGTYGVEAAAEWFFGATAATVTPAQAALLAGIIRDPEGNNPFRHPAQATARRSTVLGLLIEHGHLSQADGDAANAQPLPETPVSPPEVTDFFTDAVKNELLADPRLGATPQDRYHAVFAGGLKVHTTLDPAMQQAARETVANGLPDAAMPLTAAIVAIDPHSGEVRAIVGGPKYTTAAYNPAVEGARQPGSAFKPFTLIAALEQGYSPNDTIDGSMPCPIPNPGGKPDPWVPGNFEGEAFATVSLTDAMVHSVNCAYARLAQMTGLHAIADVAHRMGITAELEEVPSMTLGTNAVPPMDMASAYATLAASGVYHRPHLIRSVEGPDGKQIFAAHDAGKQVVDANVVAMTNQVLQQVIARGTGVAAGVPGHDVAGKTGTADDFHDAWFVGYAPELATAVWMGDPDGEVPMINVAGINVQGGSFPARMWSAFMQRVLPAGSAAALPVPAPGSVPPGKQLQPGTPRNASPDTSAPAPPGAPAGGGSWCWTSCGHAGPPPPNLGSSAPAPAPAPAPGPRPAPAPACKGHGKHKNC